MNKILSSSNRIVLAYLSTARALAQECASTSDVEEQRAKAAAAIQIAVSSVEAYLNVLARQWIDQNPGFEHADRINRDFERRKFLGAKLKEWPGLFFGKQIDFSSGKGLAFDELVSCRNKLMHFSSDSYTYEQTNVAIKGLIDTTLYESLGAKEASNAAQTAEQFIEHLLELQIEDKRHVAHALRHWTGKMPTLA
jgi:hypothetical protein